MQFALYARLIHEGKKTALDSSYFSQQKYGQKHGSVSVRPWELDVFDYQLADLPNRKAKRLRDADFSRLYLPVYRRIMKDDIFLKAKFTSNKVNLKEVLLATGFTESELEQTLAVHIRQGDFLKVASFLLRENYYIEAIKIAMDKAEVPITKIVFISDEEISPKRYPKISEMINRRDEGFQCVKLIGIEPRFVHEFMRASGVLICSNSNFSFSAAMLRTGKPSIYPSKFYEGETAALNPIFRLPMGIELDVS
jgi:hypothetical protein